MAARRRRIERTTVSTSRGVFMISVAAELAEMHPQTLRMYEARGLIEPKRSPKGTRLYSQADVERLRRIQEMTTELGLNLAGVERVLELETKLDRAVRRLEALERRSAALEAELRLAADRHHTEATPEHLLWALLDQPESIVVPALKKVETDLAAVRTALGAALDARPTITSGAREPSTARELLDVLREAE